MNPVRAWRRRLARFRSLTRQEKWLLVRIAFLHARVRRLLRARGLKAVEELKTGRITGSPSTTADPARLAWIVRVACRNGWARGNCLSESTTLWLLLKGAGHTASIRIGARRSEGGLEAHAWVELDGSILTGGAETIVEYSAFAPLPESSDGLGS